VDEHEAAIRPLGPAELALEHHQPEPPSVGAGEPVELRVPELGSRPFALARGGRTMLGVTGETECPVRRVIVSIGGRPGSVRYGQPAVHRPLVGPGPGLDAIGAVETTVGRGPGAVGGGLITV
jgi:hypothetical protein